MRRLLICAAALCFSSSALASGFVVARFGGEHGHPTTSNPTALYYNPAALSLGTGTRLFIDGTLAHRSVDYTRPVEAVQNPMNAGGASGELNSGLAQLRNFAGSPFIGLASDFGIPELNVGLGFFAPFGGGASWSERSDLSEEQRAAYPGVQDGTQRWWSIDSSLKVLYFSAGASYQLHEMVSLGLSVNYVQSSIDTVRARNSNGSDDLVQANGSSLEEGRSYLNAKGSDVSVGLGVLIQPLDTLRIGYSYQTQPGFGGVTKMQGELWSTVKANPSPEEAQEVEFHQALPAIHRLGVTWRQSQQLELRLFGDYVGWSVFEDQCVTSEIGSACEVQADGTAIEGTKPTLNIKRNWRDAFGLRLGASYWLNPMWELYVGGGYDGNAVPDETMDPSLFDMNKYSAAIGARVSLLDDSLKVALTYTQVFYETREVPVTYNEVGGAKVASNPFVTTSNGPSAAGTYEQAIGVGNLNVEYRF